MSQLLRRLRGIIGMGLTWAVGCVGIMLGITAIGGWWGEFFREIPIYATFGFVLGGAFGGILSLAERHRRLRELSLWRIALWGALGALPLLGGVSLVYGPPNLMSWIIMTALCAGLGTGSVALAKRADSKLIEGADTQLSALGGDVD